MINFPFFLYTECDLGKSIREREDTVQQVTKQEEILKYIAKRYEKLKTLLERKDQSRTRRKNTSTTLETITNGKSVTRYRSREETRNVIVFIHGGEDRTLFCAWDFLSTNTPKETMKNLIGKYKRGKYMEGIVRQTVNPIVKPKRKFSFTSCSFEVAIIMFCPVENLIRFVKPSHLFLILIKRYGCQNM